ncbi:MULTISPECIES: hypothetical protein [unclassified Rhodococcus (in: high G+C Gram-positive bacteria)]|uniref:hypothetical protein n=1 Tax=unclassified Rhodococcus (in: high G+C Gram-positive bacteria) TaxID=192944 RepID=UPI000B9A3F24|nr:MULTISPECIES: hypothetical protein [unclassified Rhodococcus (in: high G+C Gram-positive bacteria)]OZE35578.1 hypothetical protein CH259_16245 [Rhodococcus sp. 05-2254-4]OZE48007.1 hypothetical protein CH261_08840 [Rhodococcus sp. 05-2254-3]OZE49218.1 hypothetical protein CH283_16625 [Rhodococcus sp. 05-2254-2]
MTDTLIARTLHISSDHYDLDALLQDAEITFTPRGRHAIFDDDEIDLLTELAQHHRLREVG